MRVCVSSVWENGSWQSPKQCQGACSFSGVDYQQHTAQLLVLFSELIVIRGSPSLFLQIVWKPPASAIWHSKLHPHAGTATGVGMDHMTHTNPFTCLCPGFPVFGAGIVMFLLFCQGSQYLWKKIMRSFGVKYSPHS